MAKSLYRFPELIDDQNFNDTETDSIMSTFFKKEPPLHMMFRASVRLNAKLIEKCAVALSPHYANFFQQKNKGKVFNIFLSIFVGDVTLIAYTDNLILIQTKEQNVILNAPEALRFAQLLYRNFQLSFPRISEKQNVQVKAEDMELFPELDIPLSPTQNFQLTYLAECARENVVYNHDVVRYVHTLLLSRNTILDLSQLSLDLANDPTKDNISPIVRTLGEIEYLSGICCSNVQKPNILQMMAQFVQMGSNFHIVHFDGCGIANGFMKLSHVARSNPNYNVSYWNFANNTNIQDINYFPEVLSYSTAPLLYLNISNMKLQPSVVQSIFETLERIPNLQFIRSLSIGGLPFADKGVQAHVASFMNTAFENKRLQIEFLELDNLGLGLDAAFQVFTSVPLSLRYLNLRNNAFTFKSNEYVLYILKYTKTLEELDLSNTGVTPDNIARFIQVISENDSITRFKLHLDKLNLNGARLMTVLSALMDSKREKWQSLSFASNSMTLEDLKTLIAYFKRIKKLEELSLAGNFDSSMKGIGDVLVTLMKIPALSKLDISGSDEKKIKGGISELLTALDENPKFRVLDISNNALGNDAIPLIAAAMNQGQFMNEISIDNNSFTDFDRMELIVEAIKNNPNMTAFSYPIYDGKRYVDSKKKERDILIKKIADQQTKALGYISTNRAVKKMPGDLPFKASPEIIELISEITAPEKGNLKASTLLRHSLACEEMHVPLPFQSDILEETDDVKKFESKQMDVYETPSLFKYIDENKDDYKGIPFTTANPAFTDLFDQNKNIPIDLPIDQQPDNNGPPLIDPVASPEPEPKPETEPNGNKEKKAKHPKAPPPLKKKRVYDYENDNGKKKSKKNRYIQSSSDSSEEDKEEYEIATKMLTKKDLSRVIDFPDDDSSSYEEPEVSPEEVAPRYKRKEIKDEEEVHVPNKKRKLPQPSSSSSSSSSSLIIPPNKPPIDESSSSDSTPPEKPKKKETNNNLKKNVGGKQQKPAPAKGKRPLMISSSSTLSVIKNPFTNNDSSDSDSEDNWKPSFKKSSNRGQEPMKKKKNPSNQKKQFEFTSSDDY